MKAQSTKSAIAAAALAIGIFAATAPLSAQTTGSVSKASQHSSATYSTEEILAQGHQFFGKASRGLAKAVEYVFQNQGEPTAYIVGEEGAGAPGVRHARPE